MTDAASSTGGESRKRRRLASSTLEYYGRWEDAVWYPCRVSWKRRAGSVPLWRPHARFHDGMEALLPSALHVCRKRPGPPYRSGSEQALARHRDGDGWHPCAVLREASDPLDDPDKGLRVRWMDGGDPGRKAWIPLANACLDGSTAGCSWAWTRAKACQSERKTAEQQGDDAAIKALSWERVALLSEMARLNPNHRSSPLYKLGLELRKLDEGADAAAALEAFLSGPAKDAKAKRRKDAAKHWLAVIRGENTAEAPPGYIAGLFDSFAPSFEALLVDKLEYRTPQLLASEIRRLAPKRTWSRVADLGCGTGLMAPELRQLGAKRIEGVDLSEKMLRAALEKGGPGIGYDRLVLGDLLAVFAPINEADTGRTLVTGAQKALAAKDCGSPASAAECFDLVVAADVLVYLGDLARVFAAAAKWLSADGLLAVSTEALRPQDGPGGEAEAPASRPHDFRLCDTGRYQHKPSYVCATAHAAGLELRGCTQVVLRQNEGEPVIGHVYVFSRALQRIA